MGHQKLRDFSYTHRRLRLPLLICGFAFALIFALPSPAALAAPLCAQPGTWFSPQTGKRLDTPSLMAGMARRDVVLLGETHDNPDHHLWQLQVLSALHARNPNMVLAFEAFPRASQPALDKWIQGSIGEQEFLDQSRWFDVWRFDPALYMPLFRFARQNRIPMIAMNVERSLIGRIGREGFDAVPEDAREGVGKPAPPSTAYLRYLAAVFGGHSAAGAETETDEAADKINATLDDPAFQRFAEAQTTWDRAMAERLAEVRLGGGTPLVVGIVGRGHLDYGYGISHQLKALGIKSPAVLTPWDANRPCAETKNADGTGVADAAFALMTPAKSIAPEKPKLGVMIRTLEDGGGVAIDNVGADSVAAETGLEAGDVIIAAAGQNVASTRALVAIIQAQAPGSWLPLTIRRSGAIREMVAKFPPPHTDAGTGTPTRAQ